MCFVLAFVTSASILDPILKECRSIVMRYSKEWEKTISRTGRWIDFENDYKTLDPKFMESVWWVFKTLWEKDLVYKGFKVMPYSTACNTPLSNFEAGLDYRDVSDPAVMVSFPIVGCNLGASLVAWTIGQLLSVWPYLFLRHKFFSMLQFLGNLLLDFLGCVRSSFSNTPHTSCFCLIEPDQPMDSPVAAVIVGTRTRDWSRED